MSEPSFDIDAEDADIQRADVLVAALVRESRRAGHRLRVTETMARAMWQGGDITCPACGAVETLTHRGDAGHGWEIMACDATGCGFQFELSHGFTEGRLCECGQLFGEPAHLESHHEDVVADEDWIGHEEVHEAVRDDFDLAQTIASMRGPL